MKKALIYDCEIEKCIPADGAIDEDLEYCQGWEDFDGMGISVIGCYTYWDDVHHVFLEDNLLDFQALVYEADEVIGFNSISFDDKLCLANGIKVNTTYDLLCEVRIASGQPPHYEQGVTRRGYSLDALCRANLDQSKSGTGADAPILWQKGRQGSVISYCLRDIQLTRKIFELGLRGELKDPTNHEKLTIRNSEIPKYLDQFFDTWEIKEKYTELYRRLSQSEHKAKVLEDQIKREHDDRRIQMEAIRLLAQCVDDDSVSLYQVVDGLADKLRKPEF